MSGQQKMRPPYKEDHSASWRLYTNTAPVTDYFSSLQAIEAVQKPSFTTRKAARYNKFRIVPPLVSAYRPRSSSGTTRNKKQLRPKQEPVSPVMSGYGVSWTMKKSYVPNTYTTVSTPPLAMELTIIPRQLPTKQIQQYHNIPKIRSISTTHSINAIHHSRIRSFQITMPNLFQLSQVVINTLPPEQDTRAHSGRPRPIASMCL